MDFYLALSLGVGALSLAAGVLLLRPTTPRRVPRRVPRRAAEPERAFRSEVSAERPSDPPSAKPASDFRSPAARAVPRRESSPTTESLWCPTLLDYSQPALVKRLRDQIAGLTRLAGTNMRIAVAVSDPNTDMQEVVQLISTDPELGARILRVANSPSLGLRSEVKELTRAIALLGYAEIKALALRSCVDTMLGTASFRALSCKLWRHSYMCSVACQGIAQDTRALPPALASTLGLLHDLGRLAISAVDLALFHELERGKLPEDGEGRGTREEAVLGIGHAALGALIARQWGLPEDLVRGIDCHNLCYFVPPEVVPAAQRTAAALLCCAESLAAWVESRRGDPAALLATEEWEPPREYLQVLGPNLTARELARPELVQRILRARDLASAW